MLHKLKSELHKSNKNPFKDDVDWSRKKGRPTNKNKEAKVKYLDWEYKNKPKIFGFLQSLSMPTQNGDKIIIKYNEMQ